MNQPIVSLITVSFNSAKTIADTIKSVRLQNYPNIEYIIIDGGSTDETLDVIEQNSDIIDCVLSEKDDGIYDAMNKGIRLANGDVIGFINADDVLANSVVIEHVVHAIEKDGVQACYSDLVYVDQYDLSKLIRFWKASDFKSGLFSKGWSPPHPTFYVKKSVYEQFGLFSQDYKMGNDIELMLRFLEKHRIKSIYVPEIWVKMRVGGVSNQSIRNILIQNKEIIKAAKANGVPFFIPEFIFGKLIRRFFQFVLK